MGLLDYLRRIMGIGGSGGDLACGCGKRIPQRDLAAARAVVVARRAYCRDCVAERTRGGGADRSRLMDSTSRVGA